MVIAVNYSMACKVEMKKDDEGVATAREAGPMQLLLATFCINADVIFSLPLNSDTKERLLLLYDRYCKSEGRPGE